MAGTYSIGMKTDCTDCPAGSYCPTTTSEPIKCPRGYYAFGRNTACVMCPAGKQCSDSKGKIDLLILSLNSQFPTYCTFTGVDPGVGEKGLKPDSHSTGN